jgi:hypothetical protein
MARGKPMRWALLCHPHTGPLLPIASVLGVLKAYSSSSVTMLQGYYIAKTRHAGSSSVSKANEPMGLLAAMRVDMGLE